MKSNYILGTRVDIVRLDELIDYIIQASRDHAHEIICYVNVHALNLAFTTEWYRKFINNSAIVFCDGFGVVFAAKLLNQALPFRYTPPDWIGNLCEKCAQGGYSIFLLGSKPGIAERTANYLKKITPGLKISGTHHGHFNKYVNDSENEEVINLINRNSTNILLVGFGMPLQEKWLSESWDRLAVNVALPVGAMFDFLSGETRRGPAFLTNLGFEWLTRLLIEPQRLWRRYLIGNPLFLYRLLKQKFGLLHFD